MQKTTFIILSKSCVVRKGISSLLSVMDNTLVYDELDDVSSLELKTPYHIPDYLIVDFNSVDQSNISHINKFTDKFEVDLIGFGVAEEQEIKLPRCKNCFCHLDTEEQIKQKLQVIISGGDNTLTDNKKNNLLSEREKTVLEEVAKGQTNKEIADKLFISLHTVITHRKNITKKLGIKTVSGLTVYAILNNIIEMKDIEQH